MLTPDWTFFYVLGLFLCLWLVTGRMLFKPMLQLFEKREHEAVERAMLADEQLKQAAGKSEEYSRQLQRARQEAQTMRRGLLQQVDEDNRKKLDQVRGELSQQVQGARRRLQDQALQAGEKLRQGVPALARQMAEKILGRSI